MGNQGWGGKRELIDVKKQMQSKPAKEMCSGEIQRQGEIANTHEVRRVFQRFEQ